MPLIRALVIPALIGGLVNNMSKYIFWYKKEITADNIKKAIIL